MARKKKRTTSTSGRPLFDPSKMATTDDAPKPSNAGPSNTPDAPLRVGQLAAVIDRALRAGVPRPIRVLGQISGFKDRTHWYFSLKDEDAVVDCVMFAAAARKAGFAPQNGQEVIATGRVEHFARQGRTQLYVNTLAPVGLGELERKYQELCATLRARGWFDPARKRPLPAFPRKIAVVTSKTGAALQDVLDTLRKRSPFVDVVLIDARVQGDRAAPEVAAAVQWLSQHHERLGIDAVLVTRGGGSMEDLWAFNEEVVAKAIVACAVPIVAAIGHETDTTIAELVADERAATPTQAAMRLSPDRDALTEQADRLAIRLQTALQNTAKHKGAQLARRADQLATTLERANARRKHALERLGTRLAGCRPEKLHADRQTRLAEAHARMRYAMGNTLRRRDPNALRQRLDRAIAAVAPREAERLDSLLRELSAVGPIRTLQRGYSVTLVPSNTNSNAGLTHKAVRSLTDVAQGTQIVTRIAEGSFTSVVRGGAPAAQPLAKTQAAAAPPPRRKKRKKAPDPNQQNLF